VYETWFGWIRDDKAIGFCTVIMFGEKHSFFEWIVVSVNINSKTHLLQNRFTIIFIQSINEKRTITRERLGVIMMVMIAREWGESERGREKEKERSRHK
jgi:hypothetical protein